MYINNKYERHLDNQIIFNMHLIFIREFILNFQRCPTTGFDMISSQKVSKKSERRSRISTINLLVGLSNMPIISYLTIIN